MNTKITIAELDWDRSDSTTTVGEAYGLNSVHQLTIRLLQSGSPVGGDLDRYKKGKVRRL